MQNRSRHKAGTLGKTLRTIYEGEKIGCWGNEEEPRLPRKREILLPLGDSSSSSALREDLRVSLFQRLGDVETEVELGGVTAEKCEDGWELPSQRAIGIGIVG
jgi:hypothetical protein